MALSGCKKNVDVDPRDKYLWSYDLKVKMTSPAISPESNDLLLMTKTDKENGVALSTSTGKFTAKLTSDGNFKLDTYVSDENRNGFPYHVEVDGEGAISGNDLVMTLRTTLQEVGKTTKTVTACTGKRR